MAYAVTSAAGWYTGNDQLSTTANDQIDNAVFDWAFAYANITISRTDELKNSGKSQIINFVKSKVQLAEKTLASNLGDALHSGASASNQIVGLETAISSGRTYGNINSSTYSWWDAQVDSTTTTITLPAIRTIVGKATQGNDRPTVFITTQTIYNSIWGLMQPQQRYMDSDSADAGFQSLMFEGKPIIVDNHADTGYFFAINEDYIHFYVHKDENFRFEPFIKPTNQNAASAKIYWAGALVVDNPRMMGVLSAITA